MKYFGAFLLGYEINSTKDGHFSCFVFLQSIAFQVPEKNNFKRINSSYYNRGNNIRRLFVKSSKICAAY